MYSPRLPGRKKSGKGQSKDFLGNTVLTPIHGGVDDTDPQGVARRLRAGLKIYTRDDVKIRMNKRGRRRKPPTREEYMMADRFIGTMVGLRPGDPDGEVI